MLGVLLSRVLGLIREAATYRRFPPGTAALDAYIAAFRVPDLLYAVIIGGALSSTLIPVFQQVWHEEGEERAWQVASAVLNLALIVLVVLLVLVALGAAPIVGLLYPAVPPDQQRLITGLTRIFLFSPLLLGLGGVAMGLLNARERFGLPALAFNVYNLLIIFGAIVLAPAFGIWGLAYGVVTGAGLYLLVQVPGLVKAGMRYTPRLGLHDPAIRRIGRQIVPRLIGQSAVQVNFIATTSFAALLPLYQIGALNSAYQLMLLPHGIFAMSLVTVLFPQMTRLFAAGDTASFRDTALRALRLVVFVTAPIAVGMAVLRVPLIRLVYEGGAFTAASTALVAAPLLIYLTSIVAFAASEPLVRTFYAMQDTRTPVLVALVSVGLNILMGYLIVHHTTWGTAGLAFAFSVANNLEAIALLVLLLPRLGTVPGTSLLRSLGGAFAGAAVMGAGLWGLRLLSGDIFPFIELKGDYTPGFETVQLAGWLAIAGGIGVVLYLLTALVLRVPELHEARALIGRRRAGRA
jgi:putative peptidoglycan lipid II flippase